LFVDVHHVFGYFGWPKEGASAQCNRLQAPGCSSQLGGTNARAYRGPEIQKKRKSKMLPELIEAANRDLSEVELMTDRMALENLSQTFRAQGNILVCHLCDDVSELIAGILVLRASEEAWVLCGSCLRKVPMQGPLAS